MRDGGKRKGGHGGIGAWRHAWPPGRHDDLGCAPGGKFVWTWDSSHVWDLATYASHRSACLAVSSLLCCVAAMAMYP